MGVEPVSSDLILQIGGIIEIVPRGIPLPSAILRKLRSLPLRHSVNAVIWIACSLIDSMSVNCDALAIVKLIVDA